MAAFGYSDGQHSNAFRYGADNSSSAPQREQDSFSKTTIKSISPHQHNTLIVGLVLAKFGVKSFPDKKNPGNFLWKLLLTIRDSPADHINVVCWGSEEYITSLDSSCSIGDVVEVRNPNIQSKGSSPADERWRPTTSSQYQLVLSERYSSLTPYSGWDHSDFVALARIPVCSIHEYQTLASVLSMVSTQTEGSLMVNILAAVRSVGAEKQITAKTGRQLQRCEVKLMDPTCPSFSLFIWDKHIINMVQSWTPQQTVVFIVDAQVKFDSFRQAVVATCGPKTVMIVNPDCPEGHKLYRFGQQANIPPEVEDDEQNNNDITTIADLYTVKQIKSQMISKPEYVNSTTFTGFMFALVTTLDLDSCNLKRIVGSRCGLCKARIASGEVCQNSQCSSFGLAVPIMFFFDMWISLADHTDNISGVRLADQTAELFLDCTAQQFMTMNSKERAFLRSKVLLERVKVYFRACYGMHSGGSQKIRLLSVATADADEAVRLI